MVKVKQVFKRMLAEPHAKVFYSLLELAAVSSWMQLSFNINPMNNFIFFCNVYQHCIISLFPQVFSMFLDTLVKFIEEHREQLDDWLFIMLLRLIHRQGTDMLSSVHFKLQIVLEHIRLAAL